MHTLTIAQTTQKNKLEKIEEYLAKAISIMGNFKSNEFESADISDCAKILSEKLNECHDALSDLEDEIEFFEIDDDE